MTTWTLKLAAERPPLSLNDRSASRRASMARSRVIRELRQEVYALIQSAGIPPLATASIGLVWTVPDKRRRDADNPVATLKVAADAMTGIKVKGVTLPGVLPDDTPDLLVKHMPVIHYERGVKAVHIVIEGVPK